MRARRFAGPRGAEIVDRGRDDVDFNQLLADLEASRRGVG